MKLVSKLMSYLNQRSRKISEAIAICLFLIFITSFQNCTKGFEVQGQGVTSNQSLSSGSSHQEPAASSNSSPSPNPNPSPSPSPIVTPTPAPSPVPTPTPSPTPFPNPTAGDFPTSIDPDKRLAIASNYVCGITNDRNVKCVVIPGGDYFGYVRQAPTSAELSALTNVKEIVGVLEGFCALQMNGEIKCIGKSYYPEMFAKKFDGKKFKKISAGWNHVCGITTSDQLVCPGILDVDFAANPALVDVKLGPSTICILENTGKLSCEIWWDAQTGYMLASNKFVWKEIATGIKKFSFGYSKLIAITQDNQAIESMYYNDGYVPVTDLKKLNAINSSVKPDYISAHLSSGCLFNQSRQAAFFVRSRDVPYTNVTNSETIACTAGFARVCRLDKDLDVHCTNGKDEPISSSVMNLK